ncbi:CHAT domain-containing protein [Planktothricoides raciborskii]|uniref:CHAT domain-containing protein n=3 Tax=Planktothricoides raciborskii TaxID=132608 RepID=A0ABR8E7H4_9CYAN|nr:CHAT domain-containing protein [Planktothricoides raciborskii]MBD2542470.1 CHAT domain-containing protein [Planktothricoides raciborskii FACHB-1370]
MKRRITNFDGRSPFYPLFFLVLFLTLGVNKGLVFAQTITPATDGTGTVVTTEGNQINITGGKTSGDGANLFHNFQEFGLSDGQIANFLSRPEIVNILGQISGGNPSLINGLIQVTGGNSHLFLLNPAGIVFGPNAALNVLGDFTATTATSLGFDNGILQVFGNNNYTTLVGNPIYFSFDNIQPGSLINFADLAVRSGQSLSLIGGTILSTGSIAAPQGNLIITAVPGESILRISQPGHLLSLEVSLSNLKTEAFNPLSLPELLTGGGNIIDANQVRFNEAGQVVLSGYALGIGNGDVVIQPTNQSNQSATIISGNATLSAANNLTLVASNLQATGDLNLFAGNGLKIRDFMDSRLRGNDSDSGNDSDNLDYQLPGNKSYQNPFSAIAGGNMNLTGLQKIDIFALNSVNQGATFQAGGDITLISGGNIATDAHFATEGNFFIRTVAGDFGDFISYYDPIISADGNVSFDEYTGVSLKVEATGGIDAGNITITNPDVTLSGLPDPDAEILANSPALILRSGVSSLTNPANIPPDLTVINTAFLSDSEQLNRDISVSQISTPGGPVIINSGGQLIIDRIVTQGGDINLFAQGNMQIMGLLNSSADNGGNVTINGLTNVDIFAIDAQGLASDGTGGNVNINAGNFFQARGSFVDQNNRTASISTAGTVSGGSISIRHAGGSETPFIVGNATTNGTAAALTTGSETISPTFEVPVDDDGIYTQGNITIITTSNPVSEPPEEDIAVPIDSETTEETPTEETTVETPTEETTVETLIEETPIEETPIEETPIEETPIEETPIEETPTQEITSQAEEPEITTVNAIAEPSVSTVPESTNSPTIVESNPAIEQNNSQSVISSDSSTEIANVLTGSESTENSSQTVLNSSSDTTVGEILPDNSIKVGLRNIPLGIKTEIANRIDAGEISEAVPFIDRVFTEEVIAGSQVETSQPQLNSFESIQEELKNISVATQKKFALVYTVIRDEQLDVILVPINGAPIYRPIRDAGRKNMLPVVKDFMEKITSHRYRRNNRYLASAQQLYQWMIEPIEPDLEQLNIDTLVFVMDAQLRSIPLAALHDGEKFLIEKYSLGLIPSVNLTDTSYQSLANAKLLAMGSSTFKEHNLADLPGVPLEVSTITQAWSGDSFLNEAFTWENLHHQISQHNYGIVHLATHAEFVPDAPSDSYIQLWDRKLSLSELREFLLERSSPINLMILSACHSALGNETSELGFAGLAVQAKVKSAIGSIWYVDDRATLGLMSELYRQIRLAFQDSENPGETDKKSKLKAEILREAQIAMLRGDVRIENGHLIALNSDDDILLPPEITVDQETFQHPYYWAGFTLVGSPW